jgi:mannosyl-3-phosphoglycerate phosphatase
VEFWRTRLDNREPFVIENGGAVYIPKGYFGSPVPGSVKRDGYEVIELGVSYQQLVDALRDAARESCCQVLGFSDMTVAELSIRTLLPVAQAELAKRREYDEPFQIINPPAHRLLRAIEGRGLRWTRGDRFYHITGAHDKAQAVRRLIELYRARFGELVTVGLGDGDNDIQFLNSVDVPIVIRSQYADSLKSMVPRSRITGSPGPHGWSEAVLEVLAA